MAVRTFLPYIKTVAKPAKQVYSLFPQTLGDHVRKVRIENGLSQKAVSKIFSVTEDCITFWENERSQPQVRYYPIIFHFLGYYPFAHETGSIAGKLKQVRYCNGWTRKVFANVLGVDVATVTRWEQRKSVVHSKMHATIMQLWLQLPDYAKQQYLSE